MQGVPLCADGHAVARVLPSGALVILVVYVLVDTGVVHCDLFVLGLGCLPRKGSCETPEHEVLSSGGGQRGSLRAPLPSPLGWPRGPTSGATGACRVGRVPMVLLSLAGLREEEGEHQEGEGKQRIAAKSCGYEKLIHWWLEICPLSFGALSITAGNMKY